MKKFIYLACFIILLTGCSSKQDNTKELYSGVIEKYLEYTKDKDFRGNGETNSMAFLYCDDYYDGIFSTQYDINQDGTPELLISLRDLKGRYSLLDIYTNKDNDLIRLTNKENGLDSIGERMNIHILDNGTLFYRGSAGLSGVGLSVYELNDEKSNFAKTKDLQESDVNEFSERIIKLSELEWENIGVTKVIPLSKYMQTGDYGSLKGKWKNGLGEIITINENKVTSSTGYIGTMSYPESNEADGIIRISLITGEYGSAMLYIPKEYDGAVPFVDGETQANTERITISQATIGSEEVFYRFE